MTEKIPTPDSSEEYRRLLIECRRLHPEYTPMEVQEWAAYSANVHKSRADAASKKVEEKRSLISPATEQRIWGLTVVLLLVLLVSGQSRCRFGFIKGPQGVIEQGLRGK